MSAGKVCPWISAGLLFMCLGLSCNSKIESHNAEKSNSLTHETMYQKTPPRIQEKAGKKKLPDHQPGVLLVKFKPEYLRSTDRDFTATIKELGLQRMRPRTANGLDMVELTTGESAIQAASRLSEDARIQYAEPNWRIGLLAAPNDPLFSEQWGLHNTGQSVTDINGNVFPGKDDADIDAMEAWDIAHNNLDEVIVAIIDTGVAYDHEDLAANMWVNAAEKNGQPGVDDDGNNKVDDVYGWDFAEDDNDPYDYSVHGTHVAGIVAAVGNNDKGVAGVAWSAKVKIMPLRIIKDNQLPSAFVSDAIEAFEYAMDKGARIINCSWWTLGRKSQALQDTVTSAENKGIVLVAAAGNDVFDNDEDGQNSYPAEYENDNVISVAATDNQDRAAGFTNFGLMSVDVGAPGTTIMSTINSNMYPGAPLYDTMWGTSMAAPMVAGTIAVMLQHNPALIIEQSSGSYDFSPLRNALFSSIEPIPSLEGKTVTGGRVNLYRALKLIDKQNLTPVAKTGGSRMQRVGTDVILDGSGSFDPNGDEITAYNWSLKTPEQSKAQLVISESKAQFVPDVCGYYEVTLTVEAGEEVSKPNVTTVLAMNWELLKTPIETQHPYQNSVFRSIGMIIKPGATLIAPHFPQFDLEYGWDFLVFVHPYEIKFLEYYTGKRGEFTGPVFELDGIDLGLWSDDTINAHGFVADSFFWCNQNSNCPSGTGDCDLDPSTGEGGCEIDLTKNAEHCGWCDHSCSINGVGGVCVEGKCVTTELVCYEGYEDCNQEAFDGCETHLGGDANNCGECGNICELPNTSFTACHGGVCQVSACLIDWNNDVAFGDCNGLAFDGCEVNHVDDPQNCGGCRFDCARLDPSELDNVETFSGRCVLGLCELTCKPGWHDCNMVVEDGCESDLTDSENCGQCGKRCAFPGANGICVDPDAGTCEMGTCLIGFKDCDQNLQNGCEVYVAQDPSNCGACGNVCPEVANATVQCIIGSCMLQCAPGFKDCDKDVANGCEIDITSDASHCGACKNACFPFTNADSICIDSACRMKCLEPFVDCDGSIGTGCEVDIAKDPQNCGMCGKQCSGAVNADAACEEGGCTIACKENYDNCDSNVENGCEIDTSQDESHCGACNTVCAQKQNAKPLCDQGACVLDCNPGFGDCNASQSDGCEAKLDQLGQCPKADGGDDGGCHTGGSPETVFPIFLFMLSGMLWLRRYW